MLESTEGHDGPRRDPGAPPAFAQRGDRVPDERTGDVLRLEDLPDTTVRNLAVRAGRRLAAWVVAGFVAFSLPELSTPIALARQGALGVAVIGMLMTIWQLNGLLRHLGWWETAEDEAKTSDPSA
jgi:hypothetical protein